MFWRTNMVAVLIQVRPPSQPLTEGGNKMFWPIRSVALSKARRLRGGVRNDRIACTTN